MTQKDLFPEYNDLDIFTNDIAVKGVRPSLEGVDETIADIIKNCWAKDPKTRPTFKELMPILENARVDISLPKSLDPVANDFWKTRFLSSSKVPVNTFMKQLFLALSKPENAVHKNMIAHLLFGNSLALDSKNITLGKLARLIKWFGPLQQNEVTILQRMEEVLKQKWFFGTIAVDVAEAVLNTHKDAPNAFLVRLNTGGNTSIETSPFTISRKDKDGTVVHTRVYPSKQGGFYVKVDGATIKAPGQIGDFILSLLKSHHDICGSVAAGHPFEAVFAKTPQKKSVYQAGGDEEEES